MIDSLFSLPLWALAIVLNVWMMGFALASLWALRAAGSARQVAKIHHRVDVHRLLEPLQLVEHELG
jgi:hypothetical protein